MSELNEFENVAYNLYDHLHDWYRVHVSEDNGDWAAKADKLAHKLSAEFESDVAKCAQAFTTLYEHQFKEMQP